MKLKMIFLLTVLVFIFCSCGADQPEEDVKKGRYIENAIELPAISSEYTGLVQEGKDIRLLNSIGNDLISSDGGKNFAESESSAAYQKFKNYSILKATAPNGTGIFMEMENVDPFSVTGYYLVTEDGRETEIQGIDLESFRSTCYGGGYFYFEMGDTYQIYRMDPATGEVRFLLEGYYPYSMAADEKMLYLITYDKLVLYDLEKGETAQPDEILDGFIKEKLQAGTVDFNKTFLYPYGEGTYILTRDGLYWHTFYSESVEMVIDGALCSMSIPDKESLGMAVLEAEKKPEFLVFYSDGSLFRYIYDAALDAEPEISLRVYSLYEDGNIRRMVGAFREMHPELYIRYETGTGLEYGATEEDALKNLATELAAGKGPDIIIADEIPMNSYVEKGVFLNLSDIRNQMTEEDYFLNVVDGIRVKSELYTIPLSFAIPVLGGDSSKLGNLSTLSDFADLLEKERADGTEGSLLGVWNADDTLRLLAQSSQGTWMTEDSTLDVESIKDFLFQAKRIYDAQMKDQEENAWGNDATWAAGGSPLDRRFSTNGINPARHAANFSAGNGQPYFGGILGSNHEDFPLWSATIDYMKADYVLLPGQQYGACVAESLLAVNQASGHKEEAMLFVEYALSAEGQTKAGMNGIPVNKNAYLAGWKDPRGEGYENVIYSGTIIDDGDTDYDDMIFLGINWPIEEEFRKLDGLISQITEVGFCDNRVYKAVIEGGQDFLKGKLTLEETVGNIEDKMKLYLAE